MVSWKKKRPIRKKEKESFIDIFNYLLEYGENLENERKEVSQVTISSDKIMFTFKNDKEDVNKLEKESTIEEKTRNKPLMIPEDLYKTGMNNY